MGDQWAIRTGLHPKPRSLARLKRTMWPPHWLFAKHSRVKGKAPVHRWGFCVFLGKGWLSSSFGRVAATMSHTTTPSKSPLDRSRGRSLQSHRDNQLVLCLDQSRLDAVHVMRFSQRGSDQNDKGGHIMMAISRSARDRPPHSGPSVVRS